MIETCSKKRMLLAITVTLVISALVIILENRLTSASETAEVVELEQLNTAPGDARLKELRTFTGEFSTTPAASWDQAPESPGGAFVADSACWRTESFNVTAPCTRCTDFDLRAGLKAHCAPTGYFDAVFCPRSKKATFRPCLKVPALEEAKFNQAMGGAIACAVFFSLLTRWRQSILDRKAAYRIQQQLGVEP